LWAGQGRPTAARVHRPVRAFSIGVFGYIAVLAQIALIAVVTTATSRVTVNRTLDMFH
jgi:hypothetical protein